MRRLLPAFTLLLAALTAAPARAQSEGLLQVEDDLHHFLERQQVLGRLPGAALGAKPLSAYEAHALLDSLAAGAAATPEAFSTLDRRLLAEYRGEAVGGLLRGVAASVPWLYRNGTTALSVEGEDYGLEAEPLAVLAFGPVRQTARGREPTATAWQNTRGLRAAGHLDAGGGFGRLFFETRIEENQARPPEPAYAFATRTAPRLGFVARPSAGVYDYFVATGVVGYHTRRFEARFGRDRNRWGFGRESVVLSNYATVYDQLQLRWKVWRLDFTNLFTRFTEPERNAGDEILPSRYGAFHRLALDLGYGLEAEAFEAIIFAADSTGRGGFELAYLNPFQFYRGTERELGSPDNALLGVGLAWTATPGLRVYGQFILDELKVSEFFNDWWGNKWAYLVGAHVVDPPLPGGGRVHGLDLRIEYARLRPYLYAHRGLCNPNTDPNCPPYAEQPAGAAYVHYGDVLGHPAGPNASDLAVSARFRPDPDFAAALDFVYTRRGRNEVTADGALVLNYGSDPNVPFNVRPPGSDDGVETLWGVRQNRILVEARAEVRLLPQLFAGGALRYESVDDAQAGLDRYLSPQLMLRWGLPFPSLRY
ncbi:MAG TPA: hypothetical protein VK002_06050 [Rubricoccaceae bacterium]|nr:hypothetical protein [Rubricoccaceae bacterium]